MINFSLIKVSQFYNIVDAKLMHGLLHCWYHALRDFFVLASVLVVGLINKILCNRFHVQHDDYMKNFFVDIFHEY